MKTLSAVALMAVFAAAQNPPESVRMIVTVEAVRGKEVPPVKKEDVLVFQDGKRLDVREWVPCTGDHAGLELFLLIDDASETSLGSQFEEIRDFVLKQPDTTAIGAGYMRNGMVDVVQRLTTDHRRVAAALRLPAGGGSNPYASMSELIRSWPRSDARREVVLITPGAIGLNLPGDGFGNVFVDAAIADAQRAGIVVHAIYALGAGHSGHSLWMNLWAQHYLAQTAEETGGEAYSLGFGAPVSLAPYLARLGERLQHQYWLTFAAEPGTEPGLQPVRVAAETPNAEMVAAKKMYVSGP
jgi:hypothetical protein